MTLDEGVEQELIGNELAAVTFVRDYVQLSFDGPVLTLTGDLGLSDQNEAPSPNQIVGLIDQSVLAIETDDKLLSISFRNGKVLTVTPGDSPELAQYSSDNFNFVL
ncbi:MAG: hypothetical protein AAGL68_01005 [Pseudomonadota bacterium]